MKKALFYITILFLNSAIAQVSDFKNIDFTIADNTAMLHEGKSLDNLPLLAHHLTHKLNTDAEKFRAIYTWVCKNIKGDTNQEDKITKKRKKLKNDSLAYLKWNNTYKKVAFKKLLKKKRTMCTGYAYLIKELCFLANIECEIINGYGRSTEANIFDLELANHSWNAVKLNNKWYLCDATWSSGYMVNYSLFVQDYNDGYFLTDPVLFAQNHYPTQKKWLLDSTLIDSQFIASPLVYGETFKHKMIAVSPKKMQVDYKTNEEIVFSFKTLKDTNTDKITLIEYSGMHEKAFDISNIKNINGIVSFTYNFKRKGNYDVHLKMEDDIVATYTISVSKG